MSGTQCHFGTLLMAASLVIIASQVAAQTQGRSVATSNQVQAMREKCIAAAHAEYPQVGGDEFLKSRTYAYKACMTSAGMRP